MSTKPQIELFLENESGTQQVAYPFVESDHVSLSNGMDIDTMIRQDVSMPTVTHEDLSFKVGVGDQDVSSAIVDSSVAEMTIKGKTYQNILPEPSTHVLTNNKEMFKVNEGLDPNVEIVDGVSKSAILSGQTLVNLIRPISKTILEQYQDVVGVKYIEPSTKYLLKIKNNTSEAKSFYSGEITEWTNIDIDANQTITKILTTKSTLGRNTLLQNSKTHTTEHDLSIIFIKYQDGMENWDIPYFEGMQSVKMPVLTTTGKNLFDGEFILGKINDDGTNSEIKSMARSKNYIEVKPNTTYNYKWIQMLGASRIFFYDNNKQFISKGDSIPNSGGNFTTPNNCKYIHFHLGHANNFGSDTVQIEQGTTATSYEPYKSNILSTPEEVVLRSLPNGVKDTLNLNTGEYVQRIGEIVLDGSENYWYFREINENTIRVTNDNLFNSSTRFGINDKLYQCNQEYQGSNDVECLCIRNDKTGVGVRVSKQKLSSLDSNGFRQWLSQNPITVQYELATPIIKTVDLSSSGNWEKIVFDGSDDEGWSVHTSTSNLTNCLHLYCKVENLMKNTTPFSNFFQGKVYGESASSDDERIMVGGSYHIHINILKSRLDSNEVAGFKQWLSQNPITVWYQTTTTLDSTQVKQPIFFKDGHIIQSSGADHSLIPTLDYQAKTSNSYVMDLMKANTIYTMKSSTHNGGYIYIDGKDYTMGLNRQFTSPSSMTNKLLVVDGVIDNFMILEGNLTSKDIPYFKGIKSAFEDESKIEVLSTGKNLYPYGDSTYTPEHSGWYFINGDRQTLWGEKVHKDCGQGAWFYLDEGRYYFSVVNNNNVQTLQVVGDKEQLYGDGTLIPSGWYALRMSVKNANEKVNITNIMVEKATKTTYEPYKSNSTKIPLLSSLRSLPNGACDELIVDRESNKATLIQRVGCVMLDGSEEWGAYPTMEQDKTLLFQSKADCKQGKSARCVSDRFPYSGSLWNSGFDDEGVMMGGGGSTYKRVDLRISKIKVSSTSPTILREYLSKNPFVVLYELETPIITEVDLDGFPYIYKEGHIFLNSDIAPVTEIKYSINQQHQIEASNQDIIRHQKEIDYLYKLIGEYVRVDYKNTLLSLNLELK